MSAKILAETQLTVGGPSRPISRLDGNAKSSKACDYFFKEALVGRNLAQYHAECVFGQFQVGAGDAMSDPHTHQRTTWCHLRPGSLESEVTHEGTHYAKPHPMGIRSPENADEIFAKRLGEALREKETDRVESGPVVLGFFQ